MSKIDGSALIFDENDVKSAGQHLPRLIRIVFYYYGITNEIWSERYWQFFKQINPLGDKKDFNAEQAGKRKAVKESKDITYKMLSYVLMAMGYEIAGITLRVRDIRSGEIKEFSTDDTVDQLKERLKESRTVSLTSL